MLKISLFSYPIFLWFTNVSWLYLIECCYHLGRHGDIKLIDPQQLICYQEVSHHKKAIDALVFHPFHPTWLFSMASSSHCIISIFTCLIFIYVLYLPFVCHISAFTQTNPRFLPQIIFAWVSINRTTFTNVGHSNSQPRVFLVLVDLNITKRFLSSPNFRWLWR